MKSTMKRITTLLSMLVVLTGSLYAFEGGERKRGGGQGRRSGNHLEKMVFMKSKMILRHKDQLGITAEQETKIKELVQSAQKQSIKQNAEIEILEVDIRSILTEEPINTEAINKFIDQKYDLKKAKTKAIIKVISELQNILTKEQKETIKKMRAERRKDNGERKKGPKQERPF